MRKNRTLRWLFVGAVVVVGLGYLALATRVSRDAARYDAAVGFLRDSFAGPTQFWVTPLDDPRTRITDSDQGYALHCVMKTDHPDLVNNSKRAPKGEIAMRVEVRVRRQFLGLLPAYELSGLQDEAFSPVPSSR